MAKEVELIFYIVWKSWKEPRNMNEPATRCKFNTPM